MAGPSWTAAAQAERAKALKINNIRMKSPGRHCVGKVYGKRMAHQSGTSMRARVPRGKRAGWDQEKMARVAQTPPAEETPVSTVPQAQSVKTMRGVQADSVA